MSASSSIRSRLMISLPAMLVLSLGATAPAAPRKPAAKREGKAEAQTPRDQARKPPASDKQEDKKETDRSAPAELEKATFGAGCFWCTEAVFQQLKGVRSVVSGYSGGFAKFPNYDLVCTGLTGHAEVVQITFDPEVISYDELLEVFWQTHDPTTLNRQGADVGTQYRSAIFYHNEEQKKLAEGRKQQLDKEHAFRKPIVTEIVKFAEFFPAEEYHQNYYNTHRGDDSYCTAVVRPKVAKVKKVFKDKLAPEATKPHTR